MHTYRQADKQTGKHTDRQTYIHTDCLTGRHTYIHTYIQKCIHTYRQSGTQASRAGEKARHGRYRAGNNIKTANKQ